MATDDRSFALVAETRWDEVTPSTRLGDCVEWPGCLLVLGCPRYPMLRASPRSFDLEAEPRNFDLRAE